MPSAAPPDPRALRIGLAIVFGVTLWRLALLPFDEADLFVDDAQYWLWSRELAWGYYSKPPLIAWIVAASTAIGGDAPFWIRAPFPLIHCGTALLMLSAGRALWGDRTGALAGVFFVSAPAVAVGSLLLSADTPMMFCFAVATRIYVALARGAGAIWAIGLGVAVGAGLLGKYAMIYFPLGAALGALFLPTWRIGWARAGVAALAALAIVAPNLLWNLANDLATVQHTASNADLAEGGGLSPAALAEFWGAQFGVSGPLVFAAFLLGSASRRDAATRWLLALSAPAFLLVSVQALLSGANANWAAAGHVGAMLIAAATLADRPAWRNAAVGLNLLVALALPLAATQATTLSFGGEKVFGRYLGRAETSRAAAELAREAGLDAIVASDRSILADMFYTLRDEGLRIYAEPPVGFPEHHYAQRHPFPKDGGPALFVTRSSRPPECAPGAPAPELVGERTIAEGRSDRPLKGWRIDGSCWTRPAGG